MRSSLWPLFISLRPTHWVKNSLVFVPGVFSHQIFDSTVIYQSFCAFAAFCFTASAGYMINDLIDIKSDRTHPVRKYRPLASGKLSGFAAVGSIILLIVLALSIGAGISKTFLGLILFYLVVTVLYSVFLKKLVLLDTVILACLLSVRLFAGSVATQIVISKWLMSFSLFFFLSLAVLKRYVGLLHLTRTQDHGRGYLAQDASILSVIGSGSGLISVLVLSLYINGYQTSSLYPNSYLLWGLCILVFYWVGRIWILASRKIISDDPVAFVIRDIASYFVFGSAALILFGASLKF